MSQIFKLYDIELGENLKIESIYFNKKIGQDISISLETEDGNNIDFKLIYSDFLYNKNLKAVKCIIELPLLKLQRYKIKIRNNGKEEYVCWKNNQGKNLNLIDNKYIIFSKKVKIQIFDDGIKVSKRNLFSKFYYNLEKLLYGIKKYKKICIYRIFKGSSKYYLINDKIIEANDNGEELFKYINNSKLEISNKTYYVVDKNYPKIKQLRKVGKVLKFGSINHKIKYINSKIIATSSIGNTVGLYNPFSNQEMELYKDIINKKVVFLQHGIIMNDFHVMFNRYRMVIDKFVVSTQKEYNHILNDGYFYDSNMIIKTGLSRFDKLKNNTQKIILIYPTWRKALVNISEEKFEQSEYYKVFGSLLENKKINKILEKYNYKIQFVIHPELSKYIRLFNKYKTKNIRIFDSNSIIYSEMFSNCSLLITDYSSIHFDVAYLRKPILYYQFDEEYFFNNHAKRGYYSYRKDGFGEVIETELELIKSIEKILKNNCKIDDNYNKIIDKTFFYTDNNNSKRISREIVKLGKGKEKKYRFNNVQ